MATKKVKATEPSVEPKIDIVEVVEVVKEDSPAKLAYLDMMINYKKQNPAKYADKEAGFLKKLAQL